MRSKRQVRRTRPKVIVRTARGRRPRVVTVRDNFQSRSPSAKCCELYASLHDRFRLEVRILFYPMRTLKSAAWVTFIIAGMRWWEGRVEGGARVRGAAPVGSRGEAPAAGLSRNELKMFHEQILSRNEACFVKIRRQMTDYNETIIKHIFKRKMTEIIQNILKPKMTEIIKNILKPKVTGCNKTIIKNIFKRKYFHTLNVVNCVPYAMVHRTVLQWTRGEEVPLSLYERTFFAVLHFHFMTAFQRRPKRRRVSPFPNNHRRPSKVFFLFLQRFSSLFFYFHYMA